MRRYSSDGPVKDSPRCASLIGLNPSTLPDHLKPRLIRALRAFMTKILDAERRSSSPGHR